MATITGWILRHRRLVAVFWIIVALIGMASSGSATKALTQQGGLPDGYEDVDTNTALLHTLGTGGATSPLVPVIVLPRGTTVATPGIKGQLAAAFSAVQAVLLRARVVSYASTGDRAFVSADGRTTFALVYAYTTAGSPAAPPVQPIVRALAAHPIAGARDFVTGRDALASWSNAGGSGVLTGTLIGGLGALVILVLAFVALAAIPMTDTKVMATGLAAGILLDATVVRMLLVPALVSLFGRWNWWLPALPARLPRVQPSSMRTPHPTVDGARTARAA